MGVETTRRRGDASRDAAAVGVVVYAAVVDGVGDADVGDGVNDGGGSRTTAVAAVLVVSVVLRDKAAAPALGLLLSLALWLLLMLQKCLWLPLLWVLGMLRMGIIILRVGMAVVAVVVVRGDILEAFEPRRRRQRQRVALGDRRMKRGRRYCCTAKDHRQRSSAVAVAVTVAVCVAVAVVRAVTAGTVAATATALTSCKTSWCS
jgi:hypothetical protein